MTLRRLPASERIFATLVVLALTAALGLGLAAVVARELRAARPGQPPPARSRLVAVLEGVMAPNVTPAETRRFKAWVASGATREGFAQVEPVVANNCASCHGDGGQAPRLLAFEDLRPLALEPATEGLAELLDARFLHLAAFPLLVAVAAAAYLRRARWAWRKGLMAGGGLAAAWDAGQWWLRQGRPEPHWAAWTGLVLLAAAMVAIAGAVLADLWLPDEG